VITGEHDHLAPPAPAAASAAIAEVLAGPARTVRVLAAFPAAVYLEHDAGLVAVVAGDGIRHPNAVALTVGVAARPLAGVHVGQHGTVGGNAVEVGDLRVAVARWFDPVPHLRATPAGLLAAKLAVAREHLVARTGSDGHDLAGPLTVVAAAVRGGEVDVAVAAAHDLVGAGPGLTPAGDDVLAGLFAAVVTLAPAVAPAHAEALATTVGRVGAAVVARARDATTAVSAQLLHHAVRGEVAEPAATVLHAFTGRRPLTRALDALLAVGETSGRDLTYGLIAGAALVADVAEAAEVTELAETGEPAEVATPAAAALPSPPPDDPRTPIPAGAC
jgi:hypothetical protein